MLHRPCWIAAQCAVPFEGYDTNVSLALQGSCCWWYWIESGDATYPGRCPQTAGTVAKLLMASIAAAMQSRNERFQLDVMLGEEGSGSGALEVEAYGHS
jgi:hypothetical protein